MTLSPPADPAKFYGGSMPEILKDLIAHQLEAALCTVNACIDRCPDALWNAPVGNLKFCQVAFHTLFWTDFYLSPNDASFREQPFHQEHASFFADYEEFADHEPTRLYDKPAIKTYMQHCRTKLATAIAAETDESLRGPSGFARRTFSRAELHVYSIRHVQHHAAQLSLRLRLDAGVAIPWIGVGWREV
jgi:hypothetical protein